MKTKFAILFLIVIGLVQCKKDEAKLKDTPDPVTAVEMFIPPHFPQAIIPEDNPLTEEGIELGRRLYYDKKLHPDGNQSCADCHIQQYGFASVPANALPHVNLAWSTSFLWNGKLDGSLEDAMLFEITDFFPVETSTFQNDPEYVEMFEAAFGTEVVSKDLMSKAMAQFLRTVVSYNSKYDKFFRGEVQLSESEYRGYLLFNSESGDCFHCHALPLLADNQFHNTGLDSVFDASNWGRYEVTGIKTDKGKFKTPTLRNVALTPPYMHDGRFQSLEEVVEFYNSQTLNSSTLDPIMTKPGKELGLQLSASDKADLVAFLKTFNDPILLTDTIMSDPFN